MGTRASITIWNDKERTEMLVKVYRLYDGYDDGLGDELRTFLKDKKLVNGISGDESKIFNGMGCCAAMLIGELKECKVGNVYIKLASAKDFNSGEEFHYDVYPEISLSSQGFNLKYESNILVAMTES